MTNWFAAAAAFASLLGTLAAEPIRVHPANPHYFLFEGKPAILVTSAEHYGAVVNGDFNYVAYLDALQSYGLNYTRIYPGFLFEPMGKFIRGNSLGVRPPSLVLPWARSNVPGYLLGGNRFDLDRPNPAFYARLKDFIAQAAARGIVVEICFYNAQYSDTWPMSPLYSENNVQASGNCEYEDAQTLKHPDLVRHEDNYVREITRQVNALDNVILEICDEPFLTGTPIQLAGEWIAHQLEVIRKTEGGLPKKHLIAQQVEGPEDGPCDFSRNPGIGIITTQYVYESSAEQMGGMKALDVKYGLNKPIELNETDYYPAWYSGDKIADSRVEAWEFIIGGGAGFNHLNGVFTVKNPAGKTPDNEKVLGALRSLTQFMRGFDFVAMHKDTALIASGLPAGTYARAISEPGRQYAAYHHHSTRGEGGSYKVTPGRYREDLVLALPAGSYVLSWVDPATGEVVGSLKFQHAGGNRTVSTPEHSVDLAVGIKRR
jgi:hypothetical protein